jgi:carboxymethylenebutenolidase
MTMRIRIAEGIEGELAVPEPGVTVPGLIVVHEAYGINDDIRALCERLAAEGFVALAPDLYHGEVATDSEGAMALMNKLSTGSAMEDIALAMTTLRASPQTGEKIGIIGFCMGGAIAFAAAQRVPGLAAAVPFYGIPTEEFWQPEKVKIPIQAHFAKRDDWAKPDRAEAFREQVVASGGSMELHVYDAEHAFMRKSNANIYDPTSAELAWSRAIAFLKKQLT